MYARGPGAGFRGIIFFLQGFNSPDPIPSRSAHVMNTSCLILCHNKRFYMIFFSKTKYKTNHLTFGRNNLTQFMFLSMHFFFSIDILNIPEFSYLLRIEHYM